MSTLDKFLDLLKTYGPALGVFIISYYRDKAIEARNKERESELEKRLLQNKIDVENENTGLTSAAIISKYAGPGSDKL